MLSHENDLRKGMNFTHDLLWKNTYNASKTQMEIRYTKSTLLHSICTTNFGRREQFKRISILALDNQYFACDSRQEVGTLSIFQSTPPSYRLQPFPTILLFCVIKF